MDVQSRAFSDEQEFKAAVGEYFEKTKIREGEDVPFSFPTLGGLLVHLGVTKDGFNALASKYPETAAYAMTVLEAYLEQELVRRKSGVTGIIFNLQSNFGWSDKYKPRTSEPLEVTVKVVDEKKEE